MLKTGVEPPLYQNGTVISIWPPKGGNSVPGSMLIKSLPSVVATMFDVDPEAVWISLEGWLRDMIEGAVRISAIGSEEQELTLHSVATWPHPA